MRIKGAFPGNNYQRAADGLAADIIADCSMWCTFATGYVTLSGAKITEAANRKTANPTLYLRQTTDARRPDLVPDIWQGGTKEVARLVAGDSECLVTTGSFNFDAASTATIVCIIRTLAGTPYLFSKFTSSTDHFSIFINASPLTRLLGARRASATVQAAALFAVDEEIVVQLSHDGAGIVGIAVDGGPVHSFDAGGTGNAASAVAAVIGARLSSGSNPMSMDLRHVLYHPVDLLLDDTQAAKQARLMEYLRMVEGIEPAQ